MRLSTLPLVALLATATAPVASALAQAGLAGAHAFTVGGVLSGQDWQADIFHQPLFPAEVAVPLAELHLDQGGAPVEVAATMPETAHVEPFLDTDYWSNYVLDIPRFFAAPARFDTEDWIKTGAFVAVAGGAFLADERLRRFFRHNRSGVGDAIAAGGYWLGDPKAILGASAVAYGVGYVADDRRLRETALLVVQSWALTAGATEGIKYVSGRQRPGYTDNHTLFEGPGGAGKSFPSGHVSNAFSTAAVVAEQYHDVVWAAPVAYGLAGLVAWSRLNDNAHWASDVVVGAGLGYAIGKLVTHFSPFREDTGITATALAVAGGGGVQLGFRF